MEKFTTFTSRLAAMPIDNIDTDQIIPARFLKTISNVKKNIKAEKNKAEASALLLSTIQEKSIKIAKSIWTSSTFRILLR